MNRSDITAILADIDDTISRVRDLSTSPGRAAALQCLADALMHLARADLRVERSERDTEPMIPIQTSPFRSVALASVPPEWQGHFVRADYMPPSATDNQPARNKANEAFRESRRILREVIK